MRLENPICTPERLSEVSPNIAFETVRLLLFFWLKIFSLALLKKIVERFLFSRFSSPGDRWCGVLCQQVVSQAPQDFRLQDNVMTVYACAVFEDECRVIILSHASQILLPIPIHFSSGKAGILWDWCICGLAETSRSSPAECMCIHVKLDVHSGGPVVKFWWVDNIIVWATGNKTDSVVTFKASVVVTPCFTASFSPPWSHGLCWPNHPHTSWDSIFLNDRLGFSLSPPGLLIILNNVFSNALTREPRTGVGNGLCLFPFRCLLEFCQLSYFILVLLTALLDSPRPSLLRPVSSTAAWSGLWEINTTVKYALTRYTASLGATS